MSTNPVDPTYGSTSFPHEDRLSSNGNGPGRAPVDDAAFDSASSEIGSIAGAIEEAEVANKGARDGLK